MKKIFLQDQKGVGGLFFIFTSIAGALIMTVSLNLSWSSQAVAMADNLSYIVSINTAVHSYTSREEPFYGTNPVIKRTDGSFYSPLDDFNSMIISLGIASEPASSVFVEWDGKESFVQVGSFKTKLGNTVTPHRQSSAIEDE